MPEEGAAKCFAYVQTYDTRPKRRLFELMKSQKVTFLSDGADDVRERVWSSGRFTTRVRCPACADGQSRKDKRQMPVRRGHCQSRYHIGRFFAGYSLLRVIWPNDKIRTNPPYNNIITLRYPLINPSHRS